jgi:L-seryl-tRNA(Ser) seleniumtransferase
VVGFTESADLHELAALARARGLRSMVDLGSGALLPSAAQRALGLPAEPSVPEVVATGVDVACFSGDKLLGGPQAGILVGRADAIARCRSHPLMRAVRPDKLTFAALAATLALYRDGRESEIPALAMLSATDAALRARADALAARCGLPVVPTTSAVGGGAMPLASLPSWALALPASADAALRAAPVPVIGRVVDDRLLLDVRTIAAADEDAVVGAVRSLGGSS